MNHFTANTAQARQVGFCAQAATVDDGIETMLADGTVQRLKSRLTAKGYTQTRHLNFELIFSPVVRFATVRFLIALAASRFWRKHRLDAVVS